MKIPVLFGVLGILGILWGLTHPLFLRNLIGSVRSLPRLFEDDKISVETRKHRKDKDTV